MKDYDRYLRKTLEYLFAHWDDEAAGPVAAALVDGKHAAYATSLSVPGGGKRLHAERNALEKFKAVYGKPGPDAVMVVALAPCTNSRNSGREGEPCADLLQKEGIKKLYIGALDARQSPLEYYQQMGFDAALSRDPALTSTCKMLADMYVIHEQARKVEHKSWPVIKKEIAGTALCPKTRFMKKSASRTPGDSSG